MYHILKKLDIENYKLCSPHLKTVAVLPWEVQKVIFQQYSTVVLI